MVDSLPPLRTLVKKGKKLDGMTDVLERNATCLPATTGQGPWGCCESLTSQTAPETRRHAQRIPDLSPNSPGPLVTKRRGLPVVSGSGPEAAPRSEAVVGGAWERRLPAPWRRCAAGLQVTGFRSPLATELLAPWKGHTWGRRKWLGQRPFRARPRWLFAQRRLPCSFCREKW